MTTNYTNGPEPTLSAKWCFQKEAHWSIFTLMRKPLIPLVLAFFVCLLSLQAYAQYCPMGCDMAQMQGDMPSKSGELPCGQMVLCNLAAAAHVSLPSTPFTGIIFAGSSSPLGAVDEM